MIPDPLHPALVHLPMALVVLLPIFTAGVLLIINRGGKPRPSWAVVVALQVILSLSAWAAEETGERDEDYYEHGAAEEVLESHEELAEKFTGFAWFALPIAILGFLAGRIGKAARFTYLAVSIGLLLMGAKVGSLGGEIIYPDGAEATARQIVKLHGD